MWGQNIDTCVDVTLVACMYLACVHEYAQVAIKLVSLPNKFATIWLYTKRQTRDIRQLIEKIMRKYIYEG